MSRTPLPAEVVVVGNLGVAFEQMLQIMKEESLRLDFTAWRDELRAIEVKIEAGFQKELSSDEVPIDPLRMCREIRDFIDEDTILIGDGGDGLVALALEKQFLYGIGLVGKANARHQLLVEVAFRGAHAADVKAQHGLYRVECLPQPWSRWHTQAVPLFEGGGL